ncbi:hypothetical protein ACFL0U_00570 [Pseudomonadota bacterium]
MENLYKKVKLHHKFMILTEQVALGLIVISIFMIIGSFLFSEKSVVKLVGGATNENELGTQKRFMINPRLEIEDKNSFYYIKAERGYYKTKDKIIFENANINSNLGILRANEVMVENDFNNITIRDNPELIIYPKIENKD